MYSEIVKSKLGDYKISDSYQDLLESPDENLILLYDEKITLPSSLQNIKKKIAVDGSESLKTLDAAKKLITQLSDLGANRNSHLVAIGGGSVQDISTFVCSIYMRGIVWTYIPTTLMAMADSCIGGKSSINVGTQKNLVGNFYPPRAIIIDYSFTKTLSRPAISCGLFEGVKICAAKSPELADEFICESNKWIDSNSEESLQKLIGLSLTTKKWFIEVDEFDVAERKLLNYGHSFGHALESATNMQIPHGIAIGIGMLVAMEFSGNTNETLWNYIMKVLQWSKSDFSNVEFDSTKMIKSLKNDKKNSQTHQKLVLPDKNNKIHIVEYQMTESYLLNQTQITERLIRGIK